MRVARLEVFGFKSFMDRLVLPLDGGITGVVGPNGCGKSNIVDAIRWVLGETRASNLRGGTLEDVIFNGTDKLRPLGLAEVTLTLRAHEENFFADLISPQLEVEAVLKNLEKDVESPEAAPSEGSDSSRAVKLRVIAGKLGTDGEPQEEPVEFDADADDFQIQEILGDVIEEDPQNEDQISTTILARFSWLKAVSEVQITRRLYRSGESEFFINRVPCRLKDIKDFFRAIGLGARAYTIVAQGEVSRIVTSKPEDRRVIIEEAAGVVGFRDKIAASNRKLDETGHNITRLKDVIGEVERQVSSLKRQAQRALNRQSLKDEISRLETLVFTDKTLSYSDRKTSIELSKRAIAENQAAAEALLQEIQLKEEACRNELSTFDVEGDTLRTKIDSLREELLNRARQKSQRSARINEIRAFNLARATEIRRLDERRETLRSRENEACKSLDELKLKEAQLQEQINGVVLVSEDELKQVASDLRSARDRLRLKEGEIRSARDKVVSSQSSLQAIQDQLIAASPLNQLKKTLQADQVSKLVPQAKIFVEGLSVPPQYARAVQSILSERAAFLVTDAPQNIAGAFLEQTAKTEHDKKKGLGIGIFRTGTGAAVDQKQAPFPSILDLIQVKDDYVFAASRVFQNVFIVETAEQAFRYFQESEGAAGVTLVTVDGDIITDYSFYSLRHDGGLIQLQNRANELRDSLKSYEQIQEDLTGQKEAIQIEVTTLENKQSEVLRESESRQRTHRDLTNQQATVRGRLQAEQRLMEQVTQDVEKIAVQLKEIETKIEEGKQEEQRLQLESTEAVSEEDSVLEAQVTTLSEQYVKVDGVRKDGRQKLSQFAQEIHAARRDLDTARQEGSRIELDLQKLDLEQENIRTRVIAEYGDDAYRAILNVDESTDRLSDSQRDEYEQEAVRIRNKIAREGEVDSTSIERYEEEAKRLDDLEKQLSDLEDAAAILKKTIVRLEDVSKARFVQMFKAVSKNFSRLIPQLFGGGKGGLELTDPSKPLESGIEIMMRPPGKKPKSIDLLSGGEKALCATALIFSMFLEKPSPLCVLDEVDAPLDEANLLRFLTLVKEMSSKTQFMLVTHNKRSMATADNLIGVTMQEPGASKVISVSLQEAYTQVA